MGAGGQQTDAQQPSLAKLCPAVPNTMTKAIAAKAATVRNRIICVSPSKKLVNRRGKQSRACYSPHASFSTLFHNSGSANIGKNKQFLQATVLRISNI